MTVQCYQYAAMAFRDVKGSPRPIVALGNFFGLHSGLEEWFDRRTAVAPVSPGAAEGHGAPPGEVISWQMGLGDLVVFPGPIRHVGVATGLGDLLIQSGYNVQSARRAQRLRELHTLGRKQQLPKTLPLGWRERVENVGRALRGSDPVEKKNPDAEEYDNWLQEPCTVHLHLLRIVFSRVTTVLHVHHLKPAARVYLDPHGPLRPWISMQARALGITQ